MSNCCLAKRVPSTDGCRVPEPIHRYYSKPVIAFALIALSIAVFVQKEIPVYGGRRIRGRNARLLSGTAVLLLTLSFALPGQFQFLINCSVVAFGLAIYFFAKAQDGTDFKSDHLVSSSAKKEKRLGHDFLKSIVIGISVMAVLIGLVYLLILVIR